MIRVSFWPRFRNSRARGIVAGRAKGSLQGKQSGQDLMHLEKIGVGSGSFQSESILREVKRGSPVPRIR